ncbi:MAG: hypothetical protein WD844_07935 [Thermoleophilaceae bacterium]
MPVIGALIAVPRRLVGALDDLRAVAVELADIRVYTKSMEEEVARMRRGVDTLSTQVDELRGDVERLRIPRRRAGLNGRPESLTRVEASE